MGDIISDIRQHAAKPEERLIAEARVAESSQHVRGQALARHGSRKISHPATVCYCTETRGPQAAGSAYWIYNAHGGFTAVGMGFSASRFLTDHWLVSAKLACNRLQGRASASPITQSNELGVVEPRLRIGGSSPCASGPGSQYSVDSRERELDVRRRVGCRDKPRAATGRANSS